jgi:hypothetical protein
MTTMVLVPSEHHRKLAAEQASTITNAPAICRPIWKLYTELCFLPGKGGKTRMRRDGGGRWGKSAIRSAFFYVFYVITYKNNNNAFTFDFSASIKNMMIILF